MIRNFNINTTLLVIVTMITIGASVSRANYNPALSFLNTNPSAASIGMGGCSVNSVFAESMYHNPGTMGLYFLDHRVSIIAPYKIYWLPSLSDDLYLQGWAISARLRPFAADPIEGQKKLVYSIALSRKKINYGRIYYGEYNNYGSFESWERVYALTFAVGYDNRFRLGFGYNLKIANSHIYAFGNGAESYDGLGIVLAHDIGVLFEFPVHKYASLHLGSLTDSVSDLALEITPSVAVHLKNMGGDVTNGYYSETRYLPRQINSGFSLTLNLTEQGASFISLHGAIEREHELINNDLVTKRKGVELGLWGAFFFRRGNLDMSSWIYHNSVEVWQSQDTKGYGFSLAGLLDWIHRKEPATNDGSFSSFLSNHLDLSINYSKYIDNNETNISGQEAFQIALSIR